MKIPCFPVQKRNNKKDRKTIEVITGDIPLSPEVSGLLHSCITCATTAITPIIEEITVTIKPIIMKMEANLPICSLILNIMVLRVTMVILLMAISNTNVNKQDKKSAHVNDIPYLAPATTMDVTLPVPITYPTINKPGKIDCRKFLIPDEMVISCNDISEYIQKCYLIRILVHFFIVTDNSDLLWRRFK
jgi:hypothetical protein